MWAKAVAIPWNRWLVSHNKRSVPLSSSCAIHIVCLKTRQKQDQMDNAGNIGESSHGWEQCQVRCEWQQLQFELGRCSSTPTTQIQSGRTEGEDKQKLKHTSAAAREKKNPKYCQKDKIFTLLCDFFPCLKILAVWLMTVDYKMKMCSYLKENLKQIRICINSDRKVNTNTNTNTIG